jgi:hypothetical protein
VDCASCLDGAEPCGQDESCAERVCVLCTWPGEDDANALCHASSKGTAEAPNGDEADAADVGPRARALLRRSALDEGGRRPSWALYEVKDHRYRLLTAGFLGAPLEALATGNEPVDRSPAVRERIGKMGMLALIQSSRERGDDAVAHLFTAGLSVEDSVRASLESASTEREHGLVVQAALDSWPAVSDVRAVLLERALPLPTSDKRVSTVTARMAREQLIDIDGALEDEQAARALARQKDAFQLCYENAYKLEAAPAGRLVVELTVDRGGGVIDAWLSEDELDSDRLSRCVLSTVERIRFPSHPEDELDLTATLSFRRKP